MFVTFVDRKIRPIPVSFHCFIRGSLERIIINQMDYKNCVKETIKQYHCKLVHIIKVNESLIRNTENSLKTQ